MSKMATPVEIKSLRICRNCGLKAFIKADLEKFTKNSGKPYGRDNLCKECRNKRRRKRPMTLYLRKCRQCGLEVYLEKDLELLMNQPKMLYGKDNLCKKCHLADRKKGGKYYHSGFLYTKKWQSENPDKLKEARDRKILFNDRRILLDSNPRNNICEICNESNIDFVNQQNHIHHWYYDSNNLLKDTNELCLKCHRGLPKTRWVEPCSNKKCSVEKYDANLFKKCPVCGATNPIWIEEEHHIYLNQLPKKLMNFVLTIIGDK